MANWGLVHGDPGGSFSTFPLRILDQEYHGVGNAALDIDFRFVTPNNKLLNKLVIGGTAEVPNQNQWKEDSLPTPLYAVRHTTFEGDATPTFSFPAINVWRPINTTRTFAIERPAPGTSWFITITVEMAENADLLNILARAIFTLRYTRP